MANQWVYRFEEVEMAEQAAGDWEGVRGLLGGKGANLADMTRLQIPVPPGFVVTTEACNAYLAQDNTFPDEMWDQVLVAMAATEKATGRKFGDPADPLLVSCRSGAKFSMPGMMDTVLNIGLNDGTADKLTEQTQDERFVQDAYRRLVQMFGSVVMGVPAEPFEEVIEELRKSKGVESDTDLAAEDWKAITERFKEIVKQGTGSEFPSQPMDQLRLALEAVFKSWNGKRAVDYRNAAGIAHDLGTGVVIQTMVFGNMGMDSGTGVSTTRNISTGEDEIEGDYLLNAQGEDVVAGIRITKPIQELKADMPEAYAELASISERLEKHYREVQDVEFTVERSKLWMLQTRDSKRTAQAAVRIAADLADEGLITREEAVQRISPEQVDFFLHPQFDLETMKAAAQEGRLLASGLNVSPGAAVGQVALDADKAEAWAKDEGRQVIMVRPETKPDDVHGMLAAQGILTSRGGRTSHAALVARQFGKPAVVGVTAMTIDLDERVISIDGREIKEGDWISIDGTRGEVFLGQLDTKVPDFNDPYLLKILSWADDIRRLGVWANADYPEDAERARRYGAEGIGLCRTEHMFFQAERLPIVQKMILAKSSEERAEALEKLLPYQREDFAGLFRAMDGLPVIIRLIDPPLHEFLPSHDDLLVEVTRLRITGENPDRLKEQEQLLGEVEALREANPMLGLRGVRLGIHMPEVTEMQVRAIMEAAVEVSKEGVDVHPEVMIPLISHVNELKIQQAALEKVAKEVMVEQKVNIDYKFGTMIEIPRAALTAREVAEYAEFFSFGTNDLTQTTYGISRDDAEASFLVEYIEKEILPANPFQTIDPDGVGRLMRMATDEGRETRPDLEVGICGEHGGDPDSIRLCHEYGLDYVSCSPYRVPVARLAAAHAAMEQA
ncbi:MAG: pyruvate, phosphate dikinase [Chloroflexi bacterium]|nr:pyruvate, phosphate dikinase [Chloroflexota bacterium]MCI0805872.1 pyruvate, phosphate dikinase [Chloroflexota bacterium]MCI0861153.1 pyruvate, phosphate dikinase [Chloroflexota bacterium]MDK1044617.1 pyruvate, phosphate dikinase [Anaerolineales bacterium]